MHVTESCNLQEETLNMAQHLTDSPGFLKKGYTLSWEDPRFPLKLQDLHGRRIYSDNPLSPQQPAAPVRADVCPQHHLSQQQG